MDPAERWKPSGDGPRPAASSCSDQVIDRTLTRLTAFLPLSTSWVDPTPAQRGAVGRVAFAAGPGGRRSVIKVYPVGLGHRCGTEAEALRLLATRPEIPAPTLYAELGSDDDIGGCLVMSLLPGRRWAEQDVQPDRRVPLVREAAALLRRLHTSTGRWFGDLLEEPADPPGNQRQVTQRYRQARARFLDLGGSVDLVDRLRQFLETRASVIDAWTTPVFCQHDFSMGNLLVDSGSSICGIFDFERAAWDDPLNDLAKTHLQLLRHYPESARHLLEAYGISTEDELTRLQVHQSLHLLEEWNWISSDRPQNWQRSLRDLHTDLAKMALG